MTYKTSVNASTKKSQAKRRSSTPSRNRVVCIIRKVATWNPINTGQMYWATLRYAHIYSSKTPRDEMYNSPDYMWAVDTEIADSIKEAKALARGYAKKLGLRI